MPRVVPASLLALLLLAACVQGRDLLEIKGDDGDSSGKGASHRRATAPPALTLVAAACGLMMAAGWSAGVLAGHWLGLLD